MTDLHVEAHGGDVERSLAAIPTSGSTRVSLASLGDRDIDATISHVGSGQLRHAVHPRRKSRGGDRTVPRGPGAGDRPRPAVAGAAQAGAPLHRRVQRLFAGIAVCANEITSRASHSSSGKIVAGFYGRAAPVQ
jgi:hypothetical protein